MNPNKLMPQTSFSFVCHRARDCVSPSPYTGHHRNPKNRSPTTHSKTKKTTMRRQRRKSRTGHQWVHLYALCLRSPQSPVFLSGEHIEQGHKRNLKEQIQKLDRQKEWSTFSHVLNGIIFLQY